EGGTPVPHLKQWRVIASAKERQLVLEFAVPVTTGVQVFLDLVPSLPLQPNTALPTPTPQRVSFPTEGLLGFRVDGRQATLVRSLGLTGYNPDEFAGLWQNA